MAFMGIFGMNEAELKDLASKLEKQAAELKNKEIDIDSRRDELNHERELFDIQKKNLEKSREDIAAKWEEVSAKEVELNKLSVELKKQEIEARNGFIKSQQEIFKEVIENQLVRLDDRENDLNKYQAQLVEKQKALYEQEGAIAKRELAVSEREQQADAGFADKVQQMADEIKRQTNANKEEALRLSELSQKLDNEREEIEKTKASLTELKRQLNDAELKRDNGYAEERARLNEELQLKRSKCDEEINEKRSKSEEELQQKLLNALEQEQQRKANLESYLEKYKLDEISKLERELGDIKNQRMSDFNTALEADRAKFNEEKEAWNQKKEEETKALDAREKELDEKANSNIVKEKELNNQQDRLQKEEYRLNELEDKNLEHLKERENNIENEVQERLRNEGQVILEKNNLLKKQNEKLLANLANIEASKNALEIIQKRLGDKDAEQVLLELNQKNDDLKHLREELAQRPTEEMRKRYEELELKNKDLETQVANLLNSQKVDQNNIMEASENKIKLLQLENENKILKSNVTSLEALCNKLDSELRRFTEANAADKEERCKSITTAIIPMEKAIKPEPLRKTDYDAIADEQAWLKEIIDKCNNYGVKFSDRIIKSFHTSLKSSEWSPLTVLAGVSGTGKSELPKLYSHFGGLYYNLVSVQPNWDCQESMLGFFNSIDNKFDAQPVLRFLAQSQEKWIENDPEKEDYPGLDSAMCMILLDEMNLAHPELYFAEFLSKLETRRASRRNLDDIPVLDVKVGAGVTPFGLRLGRNVLWTGTMNQDETTKSLSDKVLDRSIVINFPRPTELYRRKVLNKLDKSNRGNILHRARWFKWVQMSTLFDEDVNGEMKLADKIIPYKEFVESINERLAIAGRAIGHRVWQSIEFYMSNHPDVLLAKAEKNPEALDNAMHIAFEDQIVQKIMPKLRGIDTRGNSKDKCLDEIKRLLNKGVNDTKFNLEEDFDLACELGYGQFMWQTANYLKEETVGDESGNINGNAENSAEEQSEEKEQIILDSNNIDFSQIPDWYLPKNNLSTRRKFWQSKTEEEKSDIIKNHLADSHA